jgi:putative ATP-dependent endonuclease of OLD family
MDTTLDARDLEKVRYHIREKRGALLFARCWILVEGETEYTVLPELGLILGHDFSLCGVCCVEFSQCGLKPLIKVAQDLGIEWHVLADGDQAGNTYVATATQFLGAAPEAERITQLTHRDIEHTFWHAGYDAVYERTAGTNQRRTIVKASAGSTDYPTEVIKAAIATTSKPHLAYEATTAVAANGAAGVPQELKTAIAMAVTLAGRCT